MKPYRMIARALLWVCVVCLFLALFTEAAFFTFAGSISVIVSFAFDHRASVLEGRRS